MLYCFECNKVLSHEEQNSMDHLFAGYGFCVQYCPECCPGEVDGSECFDIECYERKTGKKYEEA